MIRHFMQDELRMFADAKNHKGVRIPVLLTGDASTGKSEAAEILANELGLSYSYVACNSQMTKSELLGYRTPGGEDVDTLFTTAYVEGGVFVLEELDAASPNVILAINTAIAGVNGAFGGRMVKRHQDFVLIATTNTYNGANDKYTARGKLDESTLSRFGKLEWNLDENLEKLILSHDRLHSKIQETRLELQQRGHALLMRDVISYKAYLDSNIPYKKAADATILRNIVENQKDDFYELLFLKVVSKTPLEWKVVRKEPEEVDPTDLPEPTTEEEYSEGKQADGPQEQGGLQAQAQARTTTSENPESEDYEDLTDEMKARMTEYSKKQGSSQERKADMD